MTAATQTEINFDLDGLKRLLIFVVLLALFFFGEGYDLFYKLRGLVDERDATAAIASTGGSSLRPLAFGLLGIFGVVCWMWRPAGLRPVVHGWLPVLIFLFVVYTTLSILWADEQEIVIRRLFAFILFCIAAFGMAHRFSNRDLIMFCFVAGGLLGLASLASEISTGVFRPWLPEFRLYGIMHANVLGGVCAIFVLAALALRKASERHRTWYLLAAMVGIVLLLLTKSRASMAGLVAALFVWIVLGAQDRKRFLALTVLMLALIGPALIFLIGEDLGIGVKQTVLLGRDNNSPETLTGRLPLWDFLITRYLDDRPFFGYGFQGFWTPQHVVQVTASQDWLILHGHSGYLDLALELGYIGLGLFVAILVAGAVRSYAYFRATRDFAWLFMTGVLTWAMVGSLFDSLLLSTSLRNFICLFIFAKLALFDPRYVRVREPAYA